MRAVPAQQMKQNAGLFACAPSACDHGEEQNQPWSTGRRRRDGTVARPLPLSRARLRQRRAAPRAVVSSPRPDDGAARRPRPAARGVVALRGRRAALSSLHRPGGNITGISFFSGAELLAKRLGLLHELVPKANIIAVLLDATSDSQAEDAESAARAIGRQVVIARVASARDFDAAFAQFIKAGAG